MSSYTRRDVRFTSGHDECAAWLYEPDGLGERRRPAVVLGHGLGAVKEMGLDNYASRYAEEGYVALAFDYRHFGGSSGEPRQLLDIKRQLGDWVAAVGYARSLPSVDPDRVALFGSSFGGGHVIVTAARDHRIAAVIAQCPFTSGKASAATIDKRTLPQVITLAARDQLASVMGGQVRIPLAAQPGRPALMNAPDAEEGYLGLVPDGLEFVNEVAARVGNLIPLHHPGKFAADVQCPILFLVCDNDSVAPPGPTLKYAEQAPKGEVKRYPVGHFEIYRGEPLRIALADQVDFLHRHLD